MSKNKKRPVAAVTANPSVNLQDLKAHYTGQRMKLKRILKALADNKSYNLFEAEKTLHDHCLHSTISHIKRKHGITAARKFEMVTGYNGTPTRVKRYWFEQEQRIAALKILEQQHG